MVILAKKSASDSVFSDAKFALLNYYPMYCTGTGNVDYVNLKLEKFLSVCPKG